jgi:hypothetical protein
MLLTYYNDIYKNVIMKTPRRKRLERLRRKITKSLTPPENIVRASVFTRKRRCGGANCWCAKGEGHATTYLATTFPGGRTVQISLPSRLVPQARRSVAAYSRWWRAIERISAINRELFRKRWID